MTPMRIAAVTIGICLLHGTAAAQDFPAVVTEILKAQTDGPISEMGETKKAAVIDCVNKVLVDMPNGKKRHVLEGTDLKDRERRFGKVMKENHAEWEQNVARACADVAMASEDKVQ